MYRDMYTIVHMDEKWFYIVTKVKDWYYLVPGEALPERTTSHDNHIPKVMFLCAVARRPHFNVCKSQWFDGKVGMWPMAHLVPASARASVKRPVGTLE